MLDYLDEFSEPHPTSTPGSHPCTAHVPYPRFVEHSSVRWIDPLRAPSIVVCLSLNPAMIEQCEASRSLSVSIVVLTTINFAIGSLSGSK
jgi:hypothetical protein